jgi:hypothetical protein
MLSLTTKTTFLCFSIPASHFTPKIWMKMVEFSDAVFVRLVSGWMEHVLFQTGCSYVERSGHSSCLSHTYKLTFSTTIPKADHFVEKFVIRSVERGYRPNPAWLPGAMWNCSVCMTSSYGVVSFYQYFNNNTQKNQYYANTDFSKIWKSKIIALDGVKTSTKFQIDWSNSLKLSWFQKCEMVSGAILDFF